MFEFHKDKARYFEYQYLTARDYIIPFIEQKISLNKGFKVLEIGCGEAGVLRAFCEKEMDCVGIELSPNRVKLAKELFSNYSLKGKVNFIVKDIFKIDVNKDLDHKFDLIILKDVIEHLPEQAAFMSRLKDFLTPNGSVFFGFPPWQMPFGGHQQITESKWTKLPYIHLLPNRVYKYLLRNQKPRVKEELLELTETGISIERFEKICKKQDYQIMHKKHFLFNPIYKYKFNLTPRKQAKFISAIPYLRNYLTTCVYYHVSLIDDSSAVV